MQGHQRGTFEGKGMQLTQMRGKRKLSCRAEVKYYRFCTEKGNQSILAPSDPGIISVSQKPFHVDVPQTFFFEFGLLCLFLSSPLLSPLANFSFLAFRLSTCCPSFLSAYHCPACSTSTPTSTSAKIVLLAAITFKLSSLPRNSSAPASTPLTPTANSPCTSSRS